MNKSRMHWAKPLHNTKQYINCTIKVTNGATSSSPNILPLLHLAVSRALSGRLIYCLLKNIADMADHKCGL
jgi:hypothetical protein